MHTRRSLLLSSAALLGTAPLALGARGRSKHLVVVFAKGGWDTTYLLDPKRHVADVEGPEVDMSGEPGDVEYVQRYGDLAIAANDRRRPITRAFFDRFHDRIAVLNGLFVGSIGHDLARTRLLTGTDDIARPDLTVIAGHLRGGRAPIGCVDLSNLQFVGDFAASTLRLGSRSQIALLDSDVFFPPPAGLDHAYPLFPPDPGTDDLVRAHVQGRIDRLRAGALDPRAVARLDAHQESLERSRRFREAAGDLVLESGSGIGDKAATAVELLKRGLCHTVLLDDETDWDSHYDTASQHSYYEGLFGGVARMAEELDAAALLDDTLVMVVSEMTRSPLRNAYGGKDHWPHTSILMFGGGIAGGRRLGGTDDRLESLPVDLASGEPWAGGTVVRHDHLVAGVLEYLDVDPAEWFPGIEPYRGFRA